MKPITIFITYNPKVSNEQTLAVRLHTVGAVSGFRVYLPDRYNSESILDTETKTRIDNADFMILFSFTNQLSSVVKQEIEYAYQRFNGDASKIIVIYNTQKTLSGTMTEHFTEIYNDINKESQDQIIRNIFEKVFQKQQIEIQNKIHEAQIQKQKAEVKRLKSEKQTQNALLAFIAVGLGLAILANIAKD